MWSNHPKLTRAFPVGLLPHSSQWFEKVRWGQTAPNSLQCSLYACIPIRHSGSRRFGEVNREPPQTHSNLPCRPASPFVTVVRGGSVWLNHPKLTQGLVWLTTPYSLKPTQHSTDSILPIILLSTDHSAPTLLSILLPFY